MHQESDGEPHHRTSSQRDQCHVSGLGPQVPRLTDPGPGGQTAACDYTRCLNRLCGFPSAFVTTTEAAVCPEEHHVHRPACIHGLTVFVFSSLSRYKLKFSPDKVDTMIVQAICKFFKKE